MPRDLPDWLALSAQVTVGEVTDLGELAVRLGSPVVFDRTGDVVMFDDFEAGLGRWVSSTTGTGGVVDLSRVRARSGLFSARLVGGSTAARTAEIRRDLAVQALQALGFEFSFHIPTDISSVRWVIIAYDGTNRTEYTIAYHDTNTRLNYLNGSGSLVEFASSVDLQIFQGLFHVGKVVVDSANGRYSRFTLNATTYSLDGIAAQVSADTSNPYLSVRALILSRAAQNDVCYVDWPIVTQNEPL